MQSPYEYPQSATSPCSLVDEHFDYIVCEWLSKKLPLTSFPFALLSFRPPSLLTTDLKLPLAPPSLAAAAPTPASRGSKKRPLEAAADPLPAASVAVSVTGDPDRMLRRFYAVYQARLLPVLELNLSEHAPILKSMAEAFQALSPPQSLIWSLFLVSRMLYAQVPLKDLIEAHFPLMFARFYALYHAEYHRADGIYNEIKQLIEYV